MIMKQNQRRVTTGKGIHATPRVSISPRQPLKPKFSAQRAVFLVVLLCLSIAVYTQQNFTEISGFVNRPITKVRMDVKWQNLNETAIRQALQDSLGEGFFETDVARIKSEIEQLPWVAQASVKRIWPDTLVMQIAEHVAIARWGDAKLLNQHGEIFAPLEVSGLEHLPRLQGPEESQFQVMQQYQQFSQILFPAGLKITELTLTSRGGWELMVNDSLAVAVGRVDLTDKLARFVQFYIRQPQSSMDSFASVDLRYSNGIAVKAKESDLTELAIL